MVELISDEFHDSIRCKHKQNAVAFTWHISFRHIQKSDKNALEVLLFISRIELKALPRSMLPSVGLEQQLARAIGTLCGHSFFKVNCENGRAFDMHSLVDMATRLLTEKQGAAEKTTRNATLHLQSVFQSDDRGNGETWRQYLPHALKVLQIGENIERGSGVRGSCHLALGGQSSL
jgi:hypothetical protein